MSYERRIGRRVDIPDIPLRWTPPAGMHPSGPQLWAQRRHGRMQPVVRNVSMTGLGIIAPSNDSIVEGTLVECGLGTEVASFTGRVRRIVPTTDDAWWYYGIEFVDLTPAVQRWLNDLLAVERPAAGG